MAAPQIVATVLAVTVGAVQENVQECVLVADVWVTSPPITCVPDPAVNVPVLAATSRPPLPPPPTVRVKFTFDPDVTEVGPLQVIAGAVPLL
jgi:hypothetical protein